MIPAGIEIRSILGADAMSFSELSTLARCEAAWQFSYTGEREKTAPSKAMSLGTEIHRLWGSWWSTGVVPASEDATAALVLDRYRRLYGAQRDSGALRAVGIEVPAAARLSWGPYFFGFIDGLFEVTGFDVPDGLYVGECKSTDKLSAVTYLVQSPQTPLYVWTLRQMGLPVLGAFIDVLRTSGNEPKIETKQDAYKRFRAAGLSTQDATLKSADPGLRLTLGEPPLAETFERRFLLEPDDLDIPRALGQARRASKTRRDLLDGEPALRAVGPACSWCWSQPVCFGLDVEIVAEDTEF